ncbi:exodeoxyribonuclease V gamma subunit [Natronocella acetinitrilica]|uniref:RecBCD enzyme subunit RecC n=1 Tax=Natronocella acetinitrilica TaxID=414046 RepID=A0AAE3G7L1_9GAMM|nr:exodeoxyribonuclease V subunit gamma [Natronocella acetinitrilica]MCP1676523.1 exodeoxyribonuclease V gamma subunit [Natronocella acetinitrilica]
MFYLYHHNDLTQLAELLAELRRIQPGTGLLEPDLVLVPNRGIARWLQMQIAGSERIAANMEFPLPAGFIWQLLQKALPGNPDSTAWSREHLQWHLYQLLPELTESLPQISAYLAGDQKPLHRFQLATQLADVFDEYLVYRRDMLLQWEQSQGERRPPADWQAEVWRRLVKRLGGNHRARIMETFISLCAAGRLDVADLPSRLFCFGLGNLPPDYLRALYALGGRIDVHFLLQNPSPVYWGDLEANRLSVDFPVETELPAGEAPIESGNPLLASLGRSGRDFIRLLYSEELSGIQEPELGDVMAYRRPENASLLGAIQRDIVDLAAPTPRPLPTGQDRSLQIHACHGPLREVQVLQDQLLDLLSRDPGLQPRDIVVMLPDLQQYSPAIRSVFGGSDPRKRLPYTLSDQPRLASHPIARTFTALLDLGQSRWTTNDLMTLVAVPAVMRRLGLDEADLASLRDWVESAGVRWGLDADTRRHMGAGEDGRNTWQFGLDRLLLGLSLSVDDTPVDRVVPWSDLEGGGTAALGKLWLLVERLREWRQQLATPAAPETWHERINRLVASLIQPDPDDPREEAALASVQDAVRALEAAGACLGETPLEWESVRELLLTNLQAASERQPFLSGGITFCGMIPLRTVPFRVVCLLGMNDGDFPRQERNRGFNIVRRYRRLGDRSMRDDDRLLFLQCLLAAGETLYISYTGQDMQSGDRLEPSPIVGELLDFLVTGYFGDCDPNEARQRLITRQPMQPFSRRYFSTAAPERVFTFGAEWQAATEAQGRARAQATRWLDTSQLTDDRDSVVELRDLQALLRHPAEYFFRQRLQLRLGHDRQRLEEEDPLTLDRLAAAMLRRHLLHKADITDDAPLPETPPEHLRLAGELPPPPLDEPLFRREVVAVNQLLSPWRTWQRETPGPEPFEVDLTLAEDLRLRGRVADVWPGAVRRLQPGPLRMRHALRSWVDLLACAAAGGPNRLELIALDQGEPVGWQVAIEPDQATTELRTLLQLFRDGESRPLTFHPDLADDYYGQVGPIPAKHDPEKELKRLAVRLSPTAYVPHHLYNDAWFQPLLERSNGLREDSEQARFVALCTALCEPLLTRMEPLEVRQ